MARYVRIRKFKGEHIKCDRAFCNFNIDIIDNVNAKEYYFISHANYEEIGYKPPIEHPKFTHYIGVSQFATDKLDEWGKKLGKEIKTIKCYNPLSLEPKKKVIHLVSAARIDDVVEGGARMQKLIEALDKYCEVNGRNYIWTIFSNPNAKISVKSPNVVLMEPRIDVRPYIADADYVIQLSNDMETYCYTINESLGYGVPVVTTPLSILKELDIDDNMRIELKYDCSNVDDVAKQIFEKKVEPFVYAVPKTGWHNLLAKGKSTYQEDLKKIVKVKCIKDYTDVELKKIVGINDKPFEISKARADYLEELGLVKIIN